MRARVGLRDVTHGCDWVVLATGGFASGGIELDSHWQAREVALGLPVGRRARRASGSARSTSTSSRWAARASRSTATLRPEGLENVLVAGATLAGAQPWREKSGDGISLSTGHRAAELILGATVAASEPAGGAR